MFTVGCRRATLLTAEGFELVEYPTRTVSPLNAIKHGCRFMQSTYEKSIKISFGQLDQKLIQEKIIGSLLVQWTRSGLIFMSVFIKIVSGIVVIAPPALAEVFQTM